MKKLVFFFSISFCILTGCQQDFFVDSDCEVTVSFSTQSLSSSLKGSVANSEEKTIENLFLFGLDAQGNVIWDSVDDNPESNVLEYTLSKKVKSLYVIANATGELMTSKPSNLSNLMNMTGNFAAAPQSPFMMSGKGEVNGKNVQIELIRTVAKIEVIAENEFQISSVTVKNSPNQGYVFKKETTSPPPSAGMTTYSSVVSSNPVFYVPENSKNNPTQFLVAGTYLGKQASYTIVLKTGGTTIDIARNTHYQVSISAVSDRECSVSVSIPLWKDVTADKQTVNVPKPQEPDEPDEPVKPVKDYKNGINILAIGNSFTFNSVLYIPALLKQLGVTGPINVVLANIWSSDLSDHVKKISEGTAYTDGMIRITEGVDAGNNSTSNTTFLTILRERDWDVITMQQAEKGSANISSFTNINYIVDYIAQNARETNKGNYKIAWEMIWSGSKEAPGYGQSGQTNVYNDLRTSLKDQIAPKTKPTGTLFDFFMPTGTAIQNARGIFGTQMTNDCPIYGLGDDGPNPDYWHINNLGCYIAAATWIKTITGYDIANVQVPWQIPNTQKTREAGANTNRFTVDETMRANVVKAVNAAVSTPFSASF